MAASTIIDRAQIRHVAHLAELTLSEEEEIRLTSELGSIVGHFAELDAIDTSNVPPTAHVVASKGVWRSDEPREGLSHDDALRSAPAAAHGGFSVPTFVE